MSDRDRVGLAVSLSLAEPRSRLSSDATASAEGVSPSTMAGPMRGESRRGRVAREPGPALVVLGSFCDPLNEMLMRIIMRRSSGLVNSV